MKQANEATNPNLRYLYSLEANTILEACIDLMGINTLEKLSNYDIEKLSRDIESSMQSVKQQQQPQQSPGAVNTMMIDQPTPSDTTTIGPRGGHVKEKAANSYT